MAKKATKFHPPSKQLVKSITPDGLVSLAPLPYPVADTEIVALQVWQNPDRKPAGDGPWNNEADKVAWVDEGTGFGCIMLRQKNGTLSGYVGVGPSHPLFGFNADAIPLEVSNSVHGGVTYGKECEINRFAQEEYGDPRTERYTVCHVTVTRVVRSYRTVQATKDEFEHEDLWWLGFDTDHIGDLVPNGYDRNYRKDDTYRDQAYVYGQIVAFARRLKDIGSPERSSTTVMSETLQLPPPERQDGSN